MSRRPPEQLAHPAQHHGSLSRWAPLKSVDIPARGTETFEVTLPTPGRYGFYCDKFLHRWPFRMEGSLVAP
jgi:plastocyanin